MFQKCNKMHLSWKVTESGYDVSELIQCAFWTGLSFWSQVSKMQQHAFVGKVTRSAKMIRNGYNV